MSIEIAGQGFFAVVAGVIGGLIVYSAERIAKKFDPDNKYWWPVPFIALVLLILYGAHLAYRFR